MLPALGYHMSFLNVFNYICVLLYQSTNNFWIEKLFGYLKPTSKIRPKDVIGAFKNFIGVKWWKRKSVSHLSKD